MTSEPDYLNKAIPLDPKADDWRFSFLHLLRKRYDQAIEDCTQAINNHPPNAPAYVAAQAYLVRGMALGLKGDYEQAVKDYTQAITTDSAYVKFLLTNYEPTISKRFYGWVIEHLTAFIRLNPTLVSAYLSRSQFYRFKPDYHRTIEDYELVISLDPTSASTYNNVAWLWAVCPVDAVRNGKQAIEYAKKACELTDWKEATYVATLAAAYAEDGQFEEAVRWQLKGAVESSKYGWYCLGLYKQKEPYREE